MKNIDFLRSLAALRTPVGDTVMSVVTQLGGEAAVFLLVLTVYWCVDKKKGYSLIFLAFLGLALNQVLKITFCIPRPWELAPDFAIVESARAQAGGYSFPSGHTQNAVCLFGGLACLTKHRGVRAVCVFLTLAVAFSRLYLGVHTPLDVGVSLLLGALLLALTVPFLKRAEQRGGFFPRAWLFLLLVAALVLAYTAYLRSGVPEDGAKVQDAVKNAWCMLGGVLGLLAVNVADEAYFSFETHAVWWAQILKVVLGIALVLLVRTALKAPLCALLGKGSGPADAIRYFAMILTGGVVWPMSFRSFSRFGRNRSLRI